MNKLRTRWIPRCVLAASLGFAALFLGAYSEQPYTAGVTAGTWVSEIGGGVTLRIIESSLVHPTHTDGFVDKGDPVIVSGTSVAGVALESASAATDYINVATRGIVNLSITNAAAMAIGQDVWINTGTAALTDGWTDGMLFGHVLTAISGTGSAVTRAVWIGGPPTAWSLSSALSLSASALSPTVDGGIDLGTTAKAYGTVYAGATRFDTVNTTATNTSDLTATDDVYIEDQLTGMNDVWTTRITVGSTAEFTGAVRMDSTLATTGSITSAATVTGEQLTSTDDAYVEDQLTGMNDVWTTRITVGSTAEFTGAVLMDSTLGTTGALTAAGLITGSAGVKIGSAGTTFREAFATSFTCVGNGTTTATVALPSNSWHALNTYVAGVAFRGMSDATIPNPLLSQPYVKHELGALDVAVYATSATAGTCVFDVVAIRKY